MSEPPQHRNRQDACATLERVSRRSLRMYDLTERERRVSEVIIDYSFARGRDAALIPELQAFVDLTGLHKSNVSRALQRLVDRGIVQLSGPLEARTYAFIPSAAFWKERKPLYDMQRAIARAGELEALNENAPIDVRGQRQLSLPNEPGLDEGMAMAARDDARDEAVEPGVAKSATEPGVAKSATEPGVAKSATMPRDARARTRDVTQNDNVVTLRNVSEIGLTKREERRQFRDPERNYVFERLEETASGPDFDRYRGKWINRVRDFPAIVREAIGDVKMFRANPRNKLLKPAGAMIFRRCQEIAKAAGKTFHLW